MKRWTLYFLVFAGLHIFYFYASKISIKPFLERTEASYRTPGITNPNWSNPKAGDIFIVMDSSAAIHYYKIAASSHYGDSISVLPGKYLFKTKHDKSIYDEFDYEFTNAGILYSDTLQQYTLNDFNALKKEARLTHGFIVQVPKKPWDIDPLYLVPFQLFIQSLVAFLMIGLLVYLSKYLFAITPLSRSQVLILLSISLFIIFNEIIAGSSNFAKLNIPTYIKLSLLMLLIPVWKYIEKRWVQRLRFFDQEAIKFIFTFVVASSFSGLFALIQFWGIDYFNIDLGTNLPSNIKVAWQFYMVPFIPTTFLALATGNFLNNFRIQFFKLRKESKALETAKKSALKIQSEIETLQARINPHFLYNSLNSIASLAQDDPAKTEQMAIALSKFYKQTTNRNDQHLITVEEEMDLLKTYLEIEKIRFGERLVVEFHCDENAKTEMIPRFLLQPLIENAIKYGYNANENKTVVKLVVEKTSDNLIFKIIDHGPDFPGDLSSGYGLRSVQKKLKLFYPERHQLAFINEPEKQIFIEVAVEV